jgi:molybdopterin molybdotransferase
MLTLPEARASIAAQARPITDCEILDLAAAHKRFVVVDCTAFVDVPPAANSAMDGYALRVLQTPPPWTLSISQIIAAGYAPSPLISDTAARILTGAEIPTGADAVVIQEDCERHDDQVTVKVAVRPGENIRPKGQDMAQGQLIAARGQRLTAVDLALLASSGHGKVTVVRRPRVAIVSSGSELIPPGQPLTPGRIYDSNRFALQALLEDWGCELVASTQIADDLEATQTLLQELAPRVDLLLTTGGVSVGDADHLKTAITRLGNLDLWKVRLKPGKPLAFGHIHCATGATPVIALPGNPVSALVTAGLFVKPFIAALLGRSYEPLEFEHAPTAFAIEKPRQRPELMRARLQNGELIAAHNQSSGVLSSLQWANALAWVEADITVERGEQVPYLPMHTFLNL